MTDILSQHFQLKPGVAVRRIKEEIFFITPASAELHTLSGSGPEIWDWIQAGKTPQEIIDTLIEETDGSPEEIRADIFELFQGLIEKNIIQSHE